MKTKFKFKKDAVMAAHDLAVCIKTNWNLFSFISENHEISVTDMFVRLRSDQSTVSRKLIDLKRFGLVEDINEGKRESKYVITSKAIKVAEKIKLFVSSHP